MPDAAPSPPDLVERLVEAAPVLYPLHVCAYSAEAVARGLEAITAALMSPKFSSLLGDVLRTAGRAPQDEVDAVRWEKYGAFVLSAFLKAAAGANDA